MIVPGRINKIEFSERSKIVEYIKTVPAAFREHIKTATKF